MAMRSRRLSVVRTLFGLVVLVALAALVRTALQQPFALRAQDALPDAITAFDRPTTSSPIALSATKQHIWVVNPDDDSVSVVANLDSTALVVGNFFVADEPQAIALDTNNSDPSKYRVYVASPADNGVTVIRVTASDAGSVTAVVEVPLLVTGAEPWNVVASPDGRRVFVVNSGQDTVTVLRTDTNPPSIVGNILLAPSSCNVGDTQRHFQPRGAAVSLDNARLYVARFLSFTKPGGVQADDLGKEGIVCRIDIPPDLATLPTVAGPVSLAPRQTGFNRDSNGDGVPDATSAYPNQMQSIVVRGNRAYLPNIAASPSRPLGFNVNTQAFVSMIGNAASGTPADAGAINLHLGARDPEPGKKKLFFANPWAIGFTNESGAGQAYVVSAGSDLLVKLNVDSSGALTFTTDLSTTRYIDLNDPATPATAGANSGKNPLGIAIRNISPTNNRAYVMNAISRNLSIVNLATDSVERVIQLTTLPAAGTVDEQLLVGKEIFFSSRGLFNRPAGTTVATSERLASEGWQNCASCHFAALTDSTVWQFGAGPRKSVPLNGTWSPSNPNDQRILNYSAIFDEVQDFELNIRNVSGPGPLQNGLDPNHGLIFGDGGINTAPAAVNAFAIPNAGRPQHTVTLPGSTAAWPALDAMKEWVRFAIRTPNGALTAAELTAGGGHPSGGLSAANVNAGRNTFVLAGCISCHGGSKWTASSKDFTSPPAAGEVATELDGNGANAPNPNANPYLDRFLFEIGSFNLNVATAAPPNPIAGRPLIGGVEKDTANRDALGIDYDGDGRGAGYNTPSLLGIWALQPYYHNGACETLECVLDDATHRTRGLNPGTIDPLTDAGRRAVLVEFLKSLDAESPVPLDLLVRRHDIFLDPPSVFAGRPVVVGANISLFGTRADLVGAGAELGFSQLPVQLRLELPNGSAIDRTVALPLNAFQQDFGQVVITDTFNIPAGVVGVARVRVRIDPNNALLESSDNNNAAVRAILVRNPPADVTPPAISLARISDDDPFNENDAVVATTSVRVRIRATDPAVPEQNVSGLSTFCIVGYVYDSALRIWVPQPCVFQPLPAPEPSTTDSFLVNLNLQPFAGVAYAFVWVADAGGNISRFPAFDVVSFVPSAPFDLARNGVRILRLPLDAGQNLQVTVDVLSGDVDVAVFDDFTNPNATRIALSAQNGPVDESVVVSGPGRRQVEIRAATFSRIAIQVTPTATAAIDAAQSMAPATGTAFGDAPIVAGPPARQAAIDDTLIDLFLPLVEKPQ